jgi:predicted ferric reductase
MGDNWGTKLRQNLQINKARNNNLQKSLQTLKLENKQVTRLSLLIFMIFFSVGSLAHALSIEHWHAVFYE